MKPLTRLRLQLTAWYGGTFALLLIALGVTLLVAITRQMSNQLDNSLRDATREVARATATRELESVSAAGRAVDALDELHIPDRSLFLFDTTGAPLVARPGAQELRPLVLDAARRGSASTTLELPADRSLRAHAERFTLAGGRTYVAASTADRIELEDRYATLILTFAIAAFAALALVAAGGWWLAGMATRPVERSIEQMRRFMADAAHELRTPITVMRSRVDVTLQRERTAELYTDALRHIGRETEALAGVTDNLLTLARADSGERVLQLERIRIDEVALDAVAAAGPLAERRGVHLSIGTADEAETDGDLALIRQLMMILLDNAIKFTPEGGDVALDVTANGGAATLVVRDSGVGIEAAEQPRIFDRFFRGGGARQRASGAGLGLSIAKWIADAHGARIDVQSSPDAGTTVSVSFPAPPRVGRR
ncbi:MAG: HAMP domain-containing histidine kinase [Gemmatimonadota bacterium]|nr:HAMP domain-containing histidine kinase [Gemmatimonadota bacterium]